MPKVVIQGAKLKCSYGQSCPALGVLSTSGKAINKKKIATIDDSKPYVCIPSFGQCKSPMHPVAMSTGIIGQPCVPIVPTPWGAGAKKTTIGGRPVLIDTDTVKCVFAAGDISIKDATQALGTTQ